MIDKKLLKLIEGNLKYIIFSFIINITILLANIGITACICYALKLLLDGSKNLDSFITVMALAATAIVVRFIFSVLNGRIKSILGSKVKKDLRAKTYDKILRLNVRSTDEMSMAGLTQVSLEGIEQLDLYYTTYIPQFFYAMLAPIILFAICVPIDYKTALILLACVPLIPVSIIAVSKYAKKIFAKYWGKYTSMGDTFLDSVQGLKELKVFKADSHRNDLMNDNAEEFRRITMKVLVMQLVSTTIMDLVAYGGAGIGIAVAIFSGVNGTISPIQTLFLILVAVEFFLPLRAFGSAFHVAMNGASAGNKIISLLEAKEPEWGEEKVTDTTIKFSDVTFRYDETRDILKNVNLEFDKNKMTAIVGESGSGKSTIVSLLMGALSANSGNITVGEKAINSLSREDFYSHLAIVSYNTYIFNDTIRNNFKLANQNVTEEQIWNSLEKVNLKKFVEESGGLDKPILEDANNISGGQKQRLALAVNLVSNKDIFAFDEATSNIDIESEAIIMKNIAELKKKSTIIIISHRLENVVNADKIYVLDKGNIVQTGHHKDLVKQEGSEYATLYLRQKALEEGYKEGKVYA